DVSNEHKDRKAPRHQGTSHHSYRKASIGSNRAARCAGTKPARAAIAVMMTGTTAKAAKSAGRISKNNLEAAFETNAAHGTPTAIPIAESRRTAPRTKNNKCPELAPSAMRIPNSRVRCATEYDTTP